MADAGPARLHVTRAPLPVLRVLLACSALPGFAQTAAADRLVTRNGETLQGTVVQESADAVVFDSLTFGRLTVGRDVIVTLERATGAGMAASEEAPAAAPATEQAEPEPDEPVDRIGRYLARINPLKGWKTGLHVGLTARRGDDSDNNFNLRIRSEKKNPDGDEHLIETRYEYAEDVFSNGVRTPTDQLLTAQYQYRHNLSPQVFLQSNTRYYRDAIKELFHEGTQTIGLGYRFKGERWNATLTPAVGYRVRDIAREWSDGAVAGVYQDYQINLTRRLTFRENLEYLVAVDQSNDYSVRWGLEVSQKLGSVWALGVRYDYTYDAVVGKDASKLQQRWAVTIGVEF
jgi:putative salt-induced outer membrane protein YdiY